MIAVCGAFGLVSGVAAGEPHLRPNCDCYEHAALQSRKERFAAAKPTLHVAARAAVAHSGDMVPPETVSGELLRLYEGDFLELEVLQGNVLSDNVVSKKPIGLRARGASLRSVYKSACTETIEEASERRQSYRHRTKFSDVQHFHCSD